LLPSSCHGAIVGCPRIVKRVETALGAKFSHYRPARYFLENQATLLPTLTQDELGRFEMLFGDLYSLLGT
jgi:hypothetical protein